MVSAPADSKPVCDVAIVGAGAAGLATAIFAARTNPDLQILLFDGAKKIGAKILVSGGGRCNVTNRRVAPEDFWGGSRNTIRRVLAALPVNATIDFFREIGVALHEEEHGKLFPDSSKARTVVDALLTECVRRGVTILSDHRVHAVTPKNVDADSNPAAGSARFVVSTQHGHTYARQVVLATGGLSLPKTGSDGSGYDLARSLGHTLVPTTPGLVPLLLNDEVHAELSGIAQQAELTVAAAGQKPIRLAGALLWTHFGISGPAALDASRHWLRARLEQSSTQVTAKLLPFSDVSAAERWLIDLAATQPRSTLQTGLAALMPTRAAERLLRKLGVDGLQSLSHLSRDARRAALKGLLAWPLDVRDSRGYGYAEVTAGGVPLDEIHPGTMESRLQPGLHMVGEILDCDGRLGGFNFQWAWACGQAAGFALGRTSA